MILLFAWMLFLVEIYVVNVAEIGKEDEVSGNIGSGSMFAWVCSWSGEQFLLSFFSFHCRL